MFLLIIIKLQFCKTTGIHTPEYSYYSSSLDTKQQQDRTQGETWMLLDKVTPVVLMKDAAGEKQC